MLISGTTIILIKILYLEILKNVLKTTGSVAKFVDRDMQILFLVFSYMALFSFLKKSVISRRIG